MTAPPDTIVKNKIYNFDNLDNLDNSDNSILEPGEKAIVSEAPLIGSVLLPRKEKNLHINANIRDFGKLWLMVTYISLHFKITCLLSSVTVLPLLKKV